LGSGEEVILEGLVLVGDIDELSNTTSSNLGLLAAGEVVIVLHDVGDDGLLIRLDVGNVFNVEKLGDAKRFSNIEGKLEIGSLVILVEGVEVDEVGSVLVDESAEGKTVLPREVEVVDRNISIAGSLLLAPQEKSLLGTEFFFRNVFNLESLNDGPNETKNELQVLVDDIFRRNVNELDSLRLDELESRLNILNHLNSNLGLLLILREVVLVRDDFKELDEHYTIRKVILKAINVELSLAEVGVHPFCEGLGLEHLPVLFQLTLL